jgi:thiol-disulfide isomerase/thioredoxin
MKRLALALVLTVSFGAQAAKFQKVVGQTFPEVKVKDLFSGKEVDLAAQLKSDSIKGAVVTFTCEGCPVAKAYEERINHLAAEHGDKIVFLMLNANASETAERWTEYAKEQGYKGHVAVDDGSKLAKELGASVTPETYLLDKSGKIVFHGPIDDSQDEKYIESKLLSDAIAALLADKEIAEDKREVQAFGCGIKFPKE